MIGLEEQSKRQDELTPKELVSAQTAKEGRRCRCWDVGSRVQLSQSLVPASKGQRQTLWKPMVQTKKSLNRDWDLHSIWVRTACKKSHFYS